jgi:hypothetical protein
MSTGNGHSYLPGVVLCLFWFRALTEGSVGDFRIVAFPYPGRGGWSGLVRHRLREVVW